MEVLYKTFPVTESLGDACLSEIPFFLKYLMSAQYMISNWPITFKSTLMIPNNFPYTWS